MVHNHVAGDDPKALSACGGHPLPAAAGIYYMHQYWDEWSSNHTLEIIIDVKILRQHYSFFAQLNHCVVPRFCKIFKA